MCIALIDEKMNGTIKLEKEILRYFKDAVENAQFLYFSIILELPSFFAEVSCAFAAAQFVCKTSLL